LHSKLPIDEFYYQLKVEEAAGRLVEIREGKGATDRWIEVIR
jgi:hypothetical protein